MIRDGANAPAFSDAPPFALQRRVCAAGTATASSGAPPRRSEFATFAARRPTPRSPPSAPPVRSRGIGMMIESDFNSTEAGRNHFRNQLQSIRCALPFRPAPPPPAPRRSRLTVPPLVVRRLRAGDLQLRRFVRLPYVHQLCAARRAPPPPPVAALTPPLPPRPQTTSAVRLASCSLAAPRPPPSNLTPPLPSSHGLQTTSRRGARLCNSRFSPPRRADAC